MQRRQTKIRIDDNTEVSADFAIPNDGNGDCVILAHGAGSDMHYPLLTFLQETLARQGVVAVRFNFPYREQGRKAPDRAPRLEQTWRSVINSVRNATTPKRLFIGGRSMGGRIASMIAAQNEALDGLILLGYPLHPAGKPEKPRSEHLPAIQCPMLFIQGSRDRLCELTLLNDALTSAHAPVELHVIDQGDHSFKVPKRTGRTEADVNNDIVDWIFEWMRRVGRDN